MQGRPLLIAIMGPTASGKTALAERLADELNAGLVNADAFQVFRGLDIGTGKPGDRKRYQLLDIKDPKESFGLGEFCRLGQFALEEFWSKGQNVILVGGTGLYIRALFEEYAGLRSAPPTELRENLQRELDDYGIDSLTRKLLQLDPSAAAMVDLKNPLRVTRALERHLDPHPPIPVKLPAFARIKLGIEMDGNLLNSRIEKRVEAMMRRGWLEEVEVLLEKGCSPSDPSFRAIGYSELAGCILEGKDLEEAVATTIAETRRYAKRQRTWLRSEPRLKYLISSESELVAEALAEIQAFCNRE